MKYFARIRICISKRYYSGTEKGIFSYLYVRGAILEKVTINLSPAECMQTKKKNVGEEMINFDKWETRNRTLRNQVMLLVQCNFMLTHSNP